MLCAWPSCSGWCRDFAPLVLVRVRYVRNVFLRQQKCMIVGHHEHYCQTTCKINVSMIEKRTIAIAPVASWGASRPCRAQPLCVPHDHRTEIPDFLHGVRSKRNNFDSLIYGRARVSAAPQRWCTASLPILAPFSKSFRKNGQGSVWIRVDKWWN